MASIQKDPDKEILTRVCEIEDFFGCALVRDNLDDWGLAKDLGEFLLRLEPEELMGHALLARACRHLGDSKRAVDELKMCRDRVKNGPLVPSERELFVPFLEQEAEHWPRGEAGGDAAL